MTKHLHGMTWEEDRSQHHNSGTEGGLAVLYEYEYELAVLIFGAHL